MKKLISLLILLLTAFYISAQDEQCYIYNIVTFEGNIKTKGLKVNIDDGKSVEKLKDTEGKNVVFKTPAAALMYFIHNGWELFVNGSTSEGMIMNGFGASSTTSYWIIRKPCTKEEFDKAVEDGIKK